MKRPAHSHALTAEEIRALLVVAELEVAASFKRRHCFRHPIGSFPARLDYIPQQWAGLRALITSVRKLRAMREAALEREFRALCKAA